MNKLGILLLLATASTVHAADKANNVPPEGFKALFNGKNLEGWKGLIGDGNPYKIRAMSDKDRAAAQVEADKLAHEHWSVANGEIVFDGKGKSLCTAKDYGDFELFVDWKILPGGDSGIYLRGTPQVQIWDTEFEKYIPLGADKGSGAFWNNKTNPRFPLVKADNPVGEWNTFRIKMVGERATIWLNDKLVVDNTVLESFWPEAKGGPVLSTGTIELQNHGNTLYFRNIYIKELKGS